MFKTGPGFLSTLQRQLESFPFDELQKADQPGGLDVHDMVQLILKPRDHTVDMPENVEEKDLVIYGSINANKTLVGNDAILSGKVAFCILMGDKSFGKPKGLLRLPNLEMSLLSIKLLQSIDAKHVWVMTNAEDNSEVQSHIDSLSCRDNIKVFNQFLTFGLMPDNTIVAKNGLPFLVDCGTGDLISAIRHNGILEEFISNGGQYIVVVDSDNILSSLDATIVGQHIGSKAAITCEIVEKLPFEKDAVLCNHCGISQIISQHRLSSNSDTSQIKFIGTGVVVFNANLDFDTLSLPWHRTKKNLYNRIIVQYERMLHDMTSKFESQFILSERNKRHMKLMNQKDLISASEMLNLNNI